MSGWTGEQEGLDLARLVVANLEYEPWHVLDTRRAIWAAWREQGRQEISDLGVEVEPSPACEMCEACRVLLRTGRVIRE